LDTPFLLAQWTTVVLLHPEGHAAVMEAVVAVSPDDYTVLFALGLTPQAGV